MGSNPAGRAILQYETLESYYEKFLRRIFIKSSAKLETRRRARLGDKLFLETYIKITPRLDKAWEIILYLQIMLFAFQAGIQYNQEKFLEMWMFVACAACWVLLLFHFYYIQFPYNRQKVKMWREELAQLDTAK